MAACAAVEYVVEVRGSARTLRAVGVPGVVHGLEEGWCVEA
jgi:hypothetical protein